MCRVPQDTQLERAEVMDSIQTAAMLYVTAGGGNGSCGRGGSRSSHGSDVLASWSIGEKDGRMAERRD